jgi:uracil-DNA glycosylase
VTQTAAPWVPEHADIEKLKRGAEDCRGCELWEPARSPTSKRAVPGWKRS